MDSRCDPSSVTLVSRSLNDGLVLWPLGQIDNLPGSLLGFQRSKEEPDVCGLESAAGPEMSSAHGPGGALRPGAAGAGHGRRRGVAAAGGVGARGGQHSAPGARASLKRKRVGRVFLLVLGGDKQQGDAMFLWLLPKEAKRWVDSHPKTL